MVYTFTEAVKLVLSKKRRFNYKDRACRSEFWWFSLFSVLVNIAFISLLFIFTLIPKIGTILLIQGLIAFIIIDLLLIIISICLSIRRLHDKNLTGWLFVINYLPFGSFNYEDYLNQGWTYLLSVIPWGCIILFIIYLLKGTKGPNKYGEDPTEKKNYLKE